MKKYWCNFGGEITRLLCSLAIIVLSLTHSIPSANATQNNIVQNNISAYTLPDGTLPDFCLNSGTGLGEKANNSQCEFCRIAGEIMPQNSSDLIQLVIFKSVEILGANLNLARTNSIVLSTRSPRGPPTH